jgi:hypothetical protein
MVHTYLMAGVAMVMMTCTAMSDELKGYKGARLRGSISCIHPNIVHDLIERIGEEANYTPVARLYIEQGYCIEADIPTVLIRPMATGTFKSWDGHEAEIWETTLRLDRGDSSHEILRAYSIAFPREMERYYTD